MRHPVRNDISKEGLWTPLLSPSCHVASIFTAAIVVNSWRILPMALPLARLEDIALRPNFFDLQTEQAGDMLGNRIGGDSAVDYVAHHAARDANILGNLCLCFAETAQAIVDLNGIHG